MRVTKCYQEKWSVSSSNEHIIFNIIISLNLLKLFHDGRRYIISENYMRVLDLSMSKYETNARKNYLLVHDQGEIIIIPEKRDSWFFSHRCSIQVILPRELIYIWIETEARAKKKC